MELVAVRHVAGQGEVDLPGGQLRQRAAFADGKHQGTAAKFDLGQGLGVVPGAVGGTVGKNPPAAEQDVGTPRRNQRAERHERVERDIIGNIDPHLGAGGFVHGLDQPVEDPLAGAILDDPQRRRLGGGLRCRLRRGGGGMTGRQAGQDRQGDERPAQGLPGGFPR